MLKKNVLKYVHYSALKSKLTVFYGRHLVFFTFSSSSPTPLIAVAITRDSTSGILYKAGFSTFYIRLLFTHTASTGVNLLSNNHSFPTHLFTALIYCSLTTHLFIILISEILALGQMADVNAMPVLPRTCV